MANNDDIVMDVALNLSADIREQYRHLTERVVRLEQLSLSDNESHLGYAVASHLLANTLLLNKRQVTREVDLNGQPREQSYIPLRYEAVFEQRSLLAIKLQSFDKAL